MTEFKTRRICWPEPDATCLEGGCIHCIHQDFVSAQRIREYVEHVDVVHNRGNGKPRDPVEAWENGMYRNPERIEWRKQRRYD